VKVNQLRLHLFGMSSESNREAIYRLITNRYLHGRNIVRMGNRYYIQLPIDDNWLWQLLHKNKIKVDVVILWSWE